ncbi:hypothetical protein HBE96_04080 [Clostridium sp. P21]|uniref:Uncharacterized protein n=1 Tax=Clostridium muellerianum TaxID=2716538 RepID=A0A7Y0HNQ6_9CLOT|nr:hypothetical protein [Clostridium muellerianum]NMM61878.1 hypothetical protein [Clostridium muellerianum]
MTLISQALLEGLIWSILWIALLIPMFFHFPWLLVHDYPEDARKAARLSEVTPAQHRNGKLFTIVSYVILFGTLMSAGLLHYGGHQASFGAVFLHLWIICMMWNVVDLLILDWLIFCTITPKCFILPGTEGCKGYKDYKFHFIGFIRGCGYMTLCALVFAVIDFVILKNLI